MGMFVGAGEGGRDDGESWVSRGVGWKVGRVGLWSLAGKTVLKKFNYSDCTPVSIPLDTCDKLMPNRGLAVSQLKYSRVIGYLMYAMTCTRPDIAFAVGKLNQQHWRQFVYKWLGIPACGGAISWASKKQTCITGFTMESEFVALAATGKEAEWLKNLHLEIPLWVKPMAPISIRCDSATTLAKAYSKMYNGKSRHLGVRRSMIRELIMNEVVSIEFVRSQQNLADHLMKGSSRDLVIKSTEGMGLNVAECNSELNGIRQRSLIEPSAGMLHSRLAVQEECLKNPGLGATKNLMKPSHATRGVPVGPKVGFKPTKEYRPVSKNPTTNTRGNKKKGVNLTKKVSNSNPFDVLNSAKNNVELGTNDGT
nr:zinc finger, CCHC-type [Tanacetum cinerariifolium]